MEIRDPVHGSIQIQNEIIPIIRNDFFQRLRFIKQLGFSEYVFPGATHSRFIHSIGVMNIAERVFEKLFGKKNDHKDFEKLKNTLKLSCLLHDIGHAPLSHSTESVMPNVFQLNLPEVFRPKVNRQATHEDYTVKIITDSSLAISFGQIEQFYGVNRDRVADLVIGETKQDDYFSIDGINYFPILHQLVSSELDCDRMDYLLRDSYFCGVSYGNFDLDWMIDNLEVCLIEDSAYLGISERAVVTFDDFLLSRFHMFLMVYFHYRPVCMEQLLLKFFKTAPNEYKIPHDVEDYLEHDDHFLLKTLRQSKNKYAQSIVNNNIPSKIFESFNNNQLKKLEKIEEYLNAENIEYIRGSSQGRLSKYYNESHNENTTGLQVVRTLLNGKKKTYFDISKATDLFQKFSTSHAVNRLHCNMGEVTKQQQARIDELINE
ncbi:MAG: HD domain-containing protein [Halobacteriovoraceae bacterium]|nr:HD domain-containing protein [Halobacteriovoraceae bacterium]